MGNYTQDFGIDGQLGGNIQFVFVSNATDNSGQDNPSHMPGTKRLMADGGEAMYVKYLTVANQGDALLIDRNGNAQQITTALAAAGVGRVGICPVIGGVPAPVTLPSGLIQNSYGWAFIESDDVGVNVASGTAAGVGLATTAVPGVLGPIGAGQTTIPGLSTNAANASGAVAVTSCAATRTRLVN